MDRIEDLPVQDRVSGLGDWRMMGWEIRVDQPLDHPHCFPYRGHTGLEDQISAALHEEVFHRLDAFRHRRVVRRVAKAVQRHDRVEHRRLDTAPATVGILMSQYPTLSFPQRSLPQRLDRAFAKQLEDLVKLDKEVFPLDELG